MARRLFIAGAAALAAVAAATAGTFLTGGDAGPATVRLDPVGFEHRPDGEWRREGREIDAPRSTVTIPAAIDMMAYPVSVGDYMLCVADGACAEPAGPAEDPALPVTGISWPDANDYAVWLSARTGGRWRLPTDVEWAQGAGSLFVDDAVGVDEDPANPSARWLARYDAETRRAKNGDRTVRPVGTLNRSETGVHDIGGAVWEWTSTCLRRVNVDGGGRVTAEDETCGIYLAEGRHRAALTQFVRNPKSGGCSIGAAPENLGFRLVREKMKGLWSWLWP